MQSLEPSHIGIGDTAFDFIAQIVPDQGPGGQFHEFDPAKNWENPRDLRLHKYGGGPFCRFQIRAEGRSLDILGVYALVDCADNNNILYVGRCAKPNDTLAKRFNNGYGRIDGRNCFDNGQSTNCRINSLILRAAKAGRQISLYFHQTPDGPCAEQMEYELIRHVGKPPWNLNSPGKPRLPCARSSPDRGKDPVPAWEIPTNLVGQPARANANSGLPPDERGNFQGLKSREADLVSTCREEVIKAFEHLEQVMGRTDFGVEEIIECMRKLGSDYPETTIRTHVTSRMCATAPVHHQTHYDDLERVGRGRYRLLRRRGHPNQNGQAC